MGFLKQEYWSWLLFPYQFLVYNQYEIINEIFYLLCVLNLRNLVCILHSQNILIQTSQLWLVATILDSVGLKWWNLKMEAVQYILTTESELIYFVFLSSIFIKIP